MICPANETAGHYNRIGSSVNRISHPYTITLRDRIVYNHFLNMFLILPIKPVGLSIAGVILIGSATCCVCFTLSSCNRLHPCLPLFGLSLLLLSGTLLLISFIFRFFDFTMLFSPFCWLLFCRYCKHTIHCGKWVHVSCFLFCSGCLLFFCLAFSPRINFLSN